VRQKINDRIEIKPGMRGMKHAPGLILIVDFTAHEERPPHVGEIVRIVRAGLRDLSLKVGETKKHGSGRSFYFEGVTPADVPADAIFCWEPRKKTAIGMRRSISAGKS